MIVCPKCQREWLPKDLKILGQSYFCPECKAYIGYITDYGTEGEWNKKRLGTAGDYQ